MVNFAGGFEPAARRKPFHQGALLLEALHERGIEATAEIDHMRGLSRVDGEVRGLVYPDSFFSATEPLVGWPKAEGFLFMGYTPAPRREILAAFAARFPETTAIVPTKTGRWFAPKGELDMNYYEMLAGYEFGLCPHHPDWRGPWEAMWTYRFAECCMVGAIPVQFRATPLAESFTAGFRYVWDDDAEYTYDPADAIYNRKRAEEVFRL